MAQSKVEISQAAPASHHFPLTAPHVSSMQFMLPSVAAAIELAPNSTGSIGLKSFYRFDPVAQPLLGQMAVHQRFFFVRFASIWEPFYDFIADTNHVTSTGSQSLTQTPIVNSKDLCVALSTYGSTTTGNIFDFAVNGSRIVLNQFGRYCRSILKQLGYVVRSHDASDSGTNWSALPLMSLGKVLVDWYYPTQYAGLTATYVNVYKLFRYQQPFSLLAGDVNNILNLLSYVMYDDDLFVNAWDNPVSPNTGAFSQFQITDNSLSSGALNVVSGVAGTPIVQQSNNNLTTVSSANSITLLNQLTLYMRSHQLAGARALDRWLLDFGLSIREDKLDRSYYLGSDDAPIQFGIVESSADTNGAILGDYAGKASGFVDGKSHDFESREDFGMLLCLTTLVPKTGIVQGIKRHVMHVNKLDFFNNRFDGVGVQAISASEVYNSDADSQFNAGIDQIIFGYEPRYAEYKDLLPTLSGDFINATVATGLDQWHFFRMFDDASFGNDILNIKHSPQFIVGNDRDQFYRILSVVDPKLGDPVKCVFWIDFDLHSKMQPLYDDYLFRHLDDEKKKIKVDVNGVQVN